MQGREFAREFKLEAVRLVRERGVTIAHAARDLDLHENVLRKWVKEFAADPGHAFPGHGSAGTATPSRSAEGSGRTFGHRRQCA